MTKTFLIQIGTGVVGGALLRQVKATARPDLVYAGIFNSSSGLFDPAGLPDLDAPMSKSVTATDAIARVRPPFVVVDATGSGATLPLLKQALVRGGAVVTANKRPLAGAQSDYDELVGTGRVSSRPPSAPGFQSFAPFKTSLLPAIQSSASKAASVALSATSARSSKPAASSPKSWPKSELRVSPNPTRARIWPEPTLPAR